MNSWDQALEAGRLYRSTGNLAANLLRPHVFRAWERAHVEGANPRRPHADSLSPLDTERLCTRESKLIEAARPYMSALSGASGGERHAAMLSDARAIVLDVLGDERSVHGPERVPGPGTLLDEPACGANGLGTPLAEGGYVEIVGPEHFVEAFGLLTCQGIPLRHADGSVAGVLGIAVWRQETGQRLREILLCAAHGIEAELLQGRLKEDVRRVLAAHEPAGSALARLWRDLLETQATTRVGLGAAARELAGSRMIYARDLLELVSVSLQRFRRHAALWRELASEGAEAPRPVALHAAVHDIAELLEVEAAVHHVELVLHAIEPTVVVADPRALSRALFRCFLGAIEGARGGAVHVDVVRVPAGGELVLTQTPGLGAARAVPAPLRRAFSSRASAPDDVIVSSSTAQG